jgi:hypothetical protein
MKETNETNWWRRPARRGPPNTSQDGGTSPFKFKRRTGGMLMLFNYSCIYITRIYCCTYNTLTQQWVYRVRASRHTRIVYTHMFLFFSALASSSCVTDGLQSMPYASCAVTGSFGTTCCLVRKQQQQYIVNPFCFEFRWVDINNVPVVLFDSISQLWRLHERQAL